MSPRRFSLLLAATLVAVGLAAWAIATRQVPAAGRTVDEPLFAGLLERLDDVATIRFRRGETEATVRRDGDVWRVEQLNGYPADTAKVRDLALGLANLRVVETKTARADRLDRLDLDDPATAPADGAREVILEDAAGTVLASVVLGRERPRLFGTAGSGIYVRRGGEDQAWLAAGELDVPDEPLKFARLPILDLTESGMARITLDADGPDPVVVAKASPDEDVFTLDRTDPGMQGDVERMGRLAAALDTLMMVDVVEASERPLPADVRKVRFETWDGLIVTLASERPQGGQLPETWVQITVEAGPQLGTPPEGTTDGRPAAERAAELQRAVAPWTYRLSGAAGSLVAWTRDAVQMPVPPPGS